MSRINLFKMTHHILLMLTCLALLVETSIAEGAKACIVSSSTVDHSFIFLGLFIGALVVGLLVWIGQARKRVRRRTDSLDTDIRLTYKRYMELYPYSPISYEEYKRLQSEKAYKNPADIRKMKRMIR